MKFLIIFLASFFSLGNNCTAQRLNPALLVPYFGTNISVVEGNIFLPAYNIDIMKMWPEDLHHYMFVKSGGNETILSLRKKNKVQKITLSQAIRNRDITVFSISHTAYGRNPGIIIEPLEGVSLIGLRTKGIIVTDSLLWETEIGRDTTRYKVQEGGYDLNTMHSHTYLLNQQKIWKVINEQLTIDPIKLKVLTQSFLKNVLSDSPLNPPYYTESINNSSVHIHANQISYDSARASSVYYNDNGQHFFMLEDIIDGFKQLIAYPNKDSVAVVLHFSISNYQLDSIIIEGRWKGLVPLRICFTSGQKINLTAIFEDHQRVLLPNHVYPASLMLAYDFDDNPRVCKIKPPRIISYSIDEKSSTKSGRRCRTDSSFLVG